MKPSSLAEKRARVQRERLGPAAQPIAPAADHLRTLLAAGWTRVEIAERSGISRRALFSILNGEHSYVNRHTVNAICSIQPQDPRDRVSPVGASRRVQGLAAIGWPLAVTARDAGLHSQFVREIASGRYRRIPRAHAEAIERLSRARFLTPGPSSTARKLAARKGWVPVTLWEDIDDPACEPDRSAA
jgi:transcriptional regulator with XRE-family HTH domain